MSTLPPTPAWLYREFARVAKGSAQAILFPAPVDDGRIAEQAPLLSEREKSSTRDAFFRVLNMGGGE